MSTQAAESPLRDPVSVSCSRCCFMDYGRYEALEATAVRHAREAQHPVGLYLNLVLVGTWRPGGEFCRCTHENHGHDYCTGNNCTLGGTGR